MRSRSWAFIHFLRHSTSENKDLFEGLFEAVSEAPTAEKVVEDLIRKVDLKRLQADFDEHVRSLD